MAFFRFGKNQFFTPRAQRKIHEKHAKKNLAIIPFTSLRKALCGLCLPERLGGRENIPAYISIRIKYKFFGMPILLKTKAAPKLLLERLFLFPTFYFRLSTFDSRLSSFDFRLSIFDFRFPIFNFFLFSHNLLCHLPLPIGNNQLIDTFAQFAGQLQCLAS